MRNETANTRCSALLPLKQQLLPLPLLLLLLLLHLQLLLLPLLQHVSADQPLRQSCALSALLRKLQVADQGEGVHSEESALRRLFAPPYKSETEEVREARQGIGDM